LGRIRATREGRRTVLQKKSWRESKHGQRNRQKLGHGCRKITPRHIVTERNVSNLAKERKNKKGGRMFEARLAEAKDPPIRKEQQRSEHARSGGGRTDAKL